MEVPRGRTKPVSRSPELLAGWSSLGRSAPKGGKEDREPRQRQEEQFASLRISPLSSSLDRNSLFGFANGMHCMPSRLLEEAVRATWPEAKTKLKAVLP